MVDIPCLPSQTFWCMAVPNDPVTRQTQPTIEEIILAEQPEHAKRQIEDFWKAKCAIILSQEDVASLLAKLKQAPIDFDGVAIPEPSLFDRLIGRKVSERDKSERFYVVGSNASGSDMFAIVSAKTIHSAYLAASAEKPDLIPSAAYSESQLSDLLSTMENARVGRTNAVRAIAATDKLGAVREASAALRRSLGK